MLAPPLTPPSPPRAIASAVKMFGTDHDRPVRSTLLEPDDAGEVVDVAAAVFDSDDRRMMAELFERIELEPDFRQAGHVVQHQWQRQLGDARAGRIASIPFARRESSRGWTKPRPLAPACCGKPGQVDGFRQRLVSVMPTSTGTRPPTI